MGAMTAARARSLAAAVVVLVCAFALAGLPMSALSTRVERFVADVVLLAGDVLADPVSVDMGWVMGGTFDPDPVAAGYYQTVVDGILQHSVNFNADAVVSPLWTPEQVWPLFGDLTFGESVDQGAAILKTAILQGGGTLQQIPGYPIPGPLGNADTGVVFGYSQSATAATKAMGALHQGLAHPENLHFVLAGNPNNPLGGILTRFDFPDSPITGAARTVPLLNIPLGIGPTPTDLFPTDIYTAEYDGWASFPQDPTNLLADLNALAGILTVHSVYKDLDPADAFVLGTADQTVFHMIPTKELPILWPLYQLGEPGKVLASALEPGLRLGINWGYGNPGMAFDGVGADGIGPWAVNALGDLSAIQSDQFVAGSGSAGFLPMMDPLQMLMGIQEAGAHTFLNPVEDIFDLAGLGTVPAWFTDALHLPIGLTQSIDQWVMAGWNDLITSLDLSTLFGTGLLWHEIFDGLPLISGAPVMAGVGLVFDLLNAVIPIP
ncbi:PE-PPE domain-containing protein [Mycolicibacillus trivialis]|uniref:PE-PPE domain-containing protein n=2 Tax=Mycolicibacillus trivialis TaxID=1798 RepID=A0A1X2ELV3_9MYCO|nr:PE-PPE domain-containing protein [Mycolicibacillus trivialis]ORX05499.1 hypothetical protein AWC30_08675 [Mycolicibacillus trivialis]